MCRMAQEKQRKSKKGGSLPIPQISTAATSGNTRIPHPPMDTISAKLVTGGGVPSGGWVGFVYGGKNEKGKNGGKKPTKTKKTGSKK